MLLKSLLSNLDYTILQGTDEVSISKITWDSRNVEIGSLLICVKGKNVDRHEFAPLAVELGAVALIVDHIVDNISSDVTIIKVQDSKVAMAHVANIYYGDPSRKCNLIGVMGAYGKTSVAFSVAKILSLCGRSVGMIDSIGNISTPGQISFKKTPSNLPDSIGLQCALNEFVLDGITDVVLEISASAMSDYKYYGCKFNLCILTNSNDPFYQKLVINGDFIAPYKNLLESSTNSIINFDGTLSNLLMNNLDNASITLFGINSNPGFSANNIVYKLNNTTFELCNNNEKSTVTLSIPGKLFLENAICAIASCYKIGLKLEQIMNGIESIDRINGIFELVPNPKNHMVIIDSAFTPVTLENLLKSVREIIEGRIISVFGYGGDRDKSRRSELGEVAGRYSDYCVITSDNPRTEDPIDIMNDIAKGVDQSRCSYVKIDDRKSAVYHSLDLLRDGDAVVICGKGHETYQIFANNLVHYSDRETVNSYYSTNANL